MGQPVVLPKFELPGDKPHWAVRAAWITGALLLISIVGLGATIVHHRNAQTAAQIARAEAIAKVKAEAEAKVALAVATAKAQREAELAAKLAAQAPRPVAASATTGGEPGTDAAAKAAKGRSSHRGRLGHTPKGAKTVAKSGGKADSGKSSAAKKDDAIDELLKKMK